jgi:hypothetical protein
MATCSFLKSNDVRSLARNDLLIWTEICAIQRAILLAAADGELETIVNDGTPMTWVSGIASILMTDGGADYLPVVATATISHPTGIGAAVTPIVTFGAVSGFTVTNAGSGYAPLETTIDMTGAGNADADLRPIVNQETGEITNVLIINRGTGYLVGDPVPAVYPTGSTGTAFAATVSLVNGTGGILEVTITEEGTGYETVYATVEVQHPLGSEFEGVVLTTAGEVTGVSIQNGGFNYHPLLPSAAIIDDTGGGAVLEITESDVVGGAIQSIQIVSAGYGYSQDAEVVITPALTSSGSGAMASVTVAADPNNYGITAPLYYDVLSGQRSDRVRAGQIEFVQDYFTALGYNIRAQVNPTTGYTMQWWVIW